MVKIEENLEEWFEKMTTREKGGPRPSGPGGHKGFRLPFWLMTWVKSIIDHPSFEDGKLIGHAYGLLYDNFRKLVYVCEQSGLRIDLSGYSDYSPDTFKITIQRRDV